MGWSGNGDSHLVKLIEKLDGVIYWCNSDPTGTDVYRALETKPGFVWVDERDSDKILISLANKVTGSADIPALDVLQRRLNAKKQVWLNNEAQYAPLSAFVRSHKPADLDLHLFEEIQAFLSASTPCLLIKGPHGSGKTTLSILLQMWLADLKSNMKSLYVPIRVDLSKYDRDTMKNCVQTELGGKGFVKSLQETAHPFVFIFDGAFSFGNDFVNLWETNCISLWPYGTKVIITYCTDYITCDAHKAMCEPMEMEEIYIPPRVPPSSAS
jgi:hypothetical protein